MWTPLKLHILYFSVKHSIVFCELVGNFVLFACLTPMPFNLMLTTILFATELTKKIIFQNTLFETPILAIRCHTTEYQFRIFIDKIFDFELYILLVNGIYDHIFYILIYNFVLALVLWTFQWEVTLHYIKIEIFCYAIKVE